MSAVTAAFLGSGRRMRATVAPPTAVTRDCCWRRNWVQLRTLVSATVASATGQSETSNHVRDEGSFPPKRSPCAGDGCAAGHFQPRLLLMAERRNLPQLRTLGPATPASATGHERTHAPQQNGARMSCEPHVPLEGSDAVSVN